MSKLQRLRTVLALAALSGREAAANSARRTRDWCVGCQKRGKHRALTRSVTGARYCHGCGYFEKKDSR